MPTIGDLIFRNKFEGENDDLGFRQLTLENIVKTIKDNADKF